jgi:hypothetical protein
MGALKILEPEPKGMLLLQQRMLEYLDLRRLPEEDAQLLLRLTGGLPSVGQFVGY